MKKDRPIETLEDAVYDLIHNSSLPAKAQAEMLGVSYTRLVNSCLPSAETAHHHTRWIAPQTLATRNYALLDYLERLCGRVAIPLPDVSAPKEPEQYRAEMMRIARELGELAGVTEANLKDGRFTRDERAKNRKEAWDLIIQAVRFYKMLEE